VALVPLGPVTLNVTDVVVLVANGVMVMFVICSG
jgi:hypothetical protein